MKTEQKNGGFSGLVSRLSRQSARSDDASGRVAVEPRTVTAVAAETGYASKTLARTGSPTQITAAREVLEKARRELYLILADDPGAKER